MREENSSVILNCGCLLLIVLVNIFIGSWSINYLLFYFLDKTIPWMGAALLGLIAGEITIPVAFVMWILQQFGIL